MKFRNVLFLLVIAAFSTGILAAQSKSDSSTSTKAVLNSTAEGWNAGDLSKYLAAYIPQATEMTADGPKGGVEEIEKSMKAGFWKTGRPLQTLHYEHVEVRMLGTNYALVTGQYVLTGAGKPDRKGWFTTIWVKDGKN